ncbi:MAG: ABC transporter permease [Longimicrobiales bacterium]
MGRRVGMLLPGVPQLLRGRWLGGGTALALWVALLGLAVARFSRVSAALAGGLDARIALLTLLVTLCGVWVWSVREERGSGRKEGESGPFRAWPGLWENFRQHRMAVFGLWVVLAFYLVALLTPFLAPFDPAFQPAYQAGETGLIMAPPSATHLLGTDQLSRDIFSRILYGARISLSIGFLAVGISMTVGTVLGATAGYLGGWVDTVVTRLVDMFMAFPRLVLLIAVVAFFESSIFLIIVALALTQWPFTTRIVRGEILSLKEREYAEAARALGFSWGRIVFRHLVPNAMAPLIVAATLGIGNTIILEAGLSFLGLGVRPPTSSWGIMVATGRSYLSDAWWIATFPGLAIVLVVLAFNLVGDGLRDALDPRQARRGGM